MKAILFPILFVLLLLMYGFDWCKCSQREKFKRSKVVSLRDSFNFKNEHWYDLRCMECRWDKYKPVSDSFLYCKIIEGLCENNMLNGSDYNGSLMIHYHSYIDFCDTKYVSFIADLYMLGLTIELFEVPSNFKITPETKLKHVATIGSQGGDGGAGWSMRTEFNCEQLTSYIDSCYTDFPSDTGQVIVTTCHHSTTRTRIK
jgi:hypothetical protein